LPIPPLVALDQRRYGPTDGAFNFEGRMVDAPVLRKARRIVELTDRV
jgi:citrate lyase beta subunit